MKLLLPKDVFKDTINPKQVFHFSNSDLNTHIPHYFICVSKSVESIVFMVCCTSQFDSIRYIIEEKKFPYSTLATIQPSNENGLTVETHINCNHIFEKHIDWITDKYSDEQLNYKGILNDVHYEQILRGILDSPMVEEIIKEDCRKQLDCL